MKKYVPMLNEHHCKECGKEFYPTKLWVYKRGSVLYCSWHCFNLENKREKTKQSNRIYKQVEQLTPEKELIRVFPSINHAVEAIGGAYQSISLACRRSTLYKGYYWRYKDNDLSEMQGTDAGN